MSSKSGRSLRDRRNCWVLTNRALLLGQPRYFQPRHRKSAQSVSDLKPGVSSAARWGAAGSLLIIGFCWRRQECPVLVRLGPQFVCSQRDFVPNLPYLFDCQRNLRYFMHFLLPYLHFIYFKPKPDSLPLLSQSASPSSG